MDAFCLDDWEIPRKTLKDLQARSVHPGWDDCLFVSIDALLIPCTVFLQTPNGTKVARALGAQVRNDVGSVVLWKKVSYSGKTLREYFKVLPDDLHPFANSTTGGVLTHDVLLLDAPDFFKETTNWIGRKFEAVDDYGTCRLLSMYSKELALRVLYDADLSSNS